tara:strand:+ start:2492 stop:3184 length:693 start_codon:yes stop_codon:yes gene_type:complete
MPTSDSIAQNLEKVEARIAGACEKAGRPRDEVELLAVSKTWPAETIFQAVDAGITAFGENKVQEAIAKVPLLPERITWHLIGNLQKNKVRKSLAVIDTYHGIDSLDLAQQMNRIAEELGLHPSVYLQVNLAGEASKHGFSPDNLRRDLDAILDLDRLELQGLMIIPPFDPEPENVRPHFANLRQFRDELAEKSGVPLNGLSMGMSHDFEIAIEEGSTVVRVGSAIFGSRK